jgi:uncharacterized protein
MNTRLLTFLLLLTFAGSALRAAPPVTLAGTEQHALASAKIGQTYLLKVSLPDDYATSGRAYPVLYILDGWHFPLLAFLQNNNIYSERMGPVIMVNISHGDGINPMPLRARDFTPTHLAEEPTSGGAAAFLDFLEHEVIPFVERTYRTDPADRGLLAHSYGGLFALYALVERPALFHRIVAASPVAGWDHNWLFPRAQKSLAHLPHPVRLDLSAGDEGDLERLLKTQTVAFADLLTTMKAPGLEFRLTLFPGENHNSIRLLSFPHGLYWVYGK